MHHTNVWLQTALHTTQASLLVNLPCRHLCIHIHVCGESSCRYMDLRSSYALVLTWRREVCDLYPGLHDLHRESVCGCGCQRYGALGLASFAALHVCAAPGLASFPIQARQPNLCALNGLGTGSRVTCAHAWVRWYNNCTVLVYARRSRSYVVPYKRTGQAASRYLAEP